MDERAPSESDNPRPSRASRRRFFSIASGGVAAFSLKPTVAAAAQTTAAAGDAGAVRVGAVDLASIPIVDTHVHQPQRITLSESYQRWNSSFVDSMVPPYEFDGRAALHEQRTREFVDQIWNLPRQTGYCNYMTRTYGVQPTLAGFDSVVSKHISSDADFRRYIGTILDRERIRHIVLQSPDAEPKAPATPVPPGRFVWTYAFAHLVHPEWAISRRLSSVDDVTRSIETVLEQVVAAGCRGFKNGTAYFRPLAFDRVSKADAQAALQPLLTAKPDGVLAQGAPFYAAPALQAALRTYQDYLLRHITVHAGRLKRPIIMHSAVALHPALRLEWNSPLNLDKVFLDEDVQKAGTQFVLIHAGYPSHHAVAAMLSQFPNLFADVSFYSKFPGVLEEIYRAFLSLAPPTKVMHGSDSNNVPEEIGYCAWNTRQALARVLNDFRAYGWTDADCARVANGVLFENATRVFGLPT